MPAPHIYLDHNSTTPLDPRVLEAMTKTWRDCGANPASQHGPGRAARRMLEEAREGIAEQLGARTGGMDADRVIFTSGGTEANNLLVQTGHFSLPPHAGARKVTIAGIEHPSITAAVQRFPHVRIRVTALGIVSLDSLADVLVGARNRAVSVMLANNETGVIQPVADLARICRKHDVLIHTDAVQAVGKIAVNFRDLGVDAMTVAPHKFHGPLGIGALVVKHELKLKPLLFGGFQQEGLRPGTENVALAVGFHRALQLAVAELPQRAARMQSLRDELERLLRAEIPDLFVVGEQAERLPNTSNVSFPGVNRQALVMALDLAGIACSTGSACASGSSEPSPVLLAMGLPKDVVEGSIRLSLGTFTVEAEVAEAARRIIKAVHHLRSRK